MISNVIFMGDPHRGDQATNILKTQVLFSPVLLQLGVESVVHITEINQSTNRAEWIPLWKNALSSNLPPITQTLNLVNSAIIGFELPDNEILYLNKNNIPWVNIKIHPMRFLDDLYLDVTSSFKFEVNSLEASIGIISICLNRLKSEFSVNLDDNTEKTLLICEQVSFDKSIYFDNGFKDLTDYFEVLDDLAKKYEKIIYKPHPALSSQEITNVVMGRYNAQLCESTNIYDLFLSGSIDTVCAISSSVLTEAPYFGVNSVYLEPKANRFGPIISYKSLLDNIEFWEQGLLGRSIGQKKSLNLSEAVPLNYLRKLFGSWSFITDDMKISQNVNFLEAKIERVNIDIKEIEAKIIQAEDKARQAEASRHAEARAQQAEATARQAEATAQQAEAKAEDAKQKVHNFEQTITAIYSSRSWRITYPMRWSFHQARLLREFGFKKRSEAATRKIAKPILIRAFNYVDRHPRLRKSFLNILHRLGLYTRFKSIYVNRDFNQVSTEQHTIQLNIKLNSSELSPRARQIYQDLKTAIETNKEQQ